MTLPQISLLAQAEPPAGGAALDQIVIANLAVGVLAAALLYFAMGHRSGRVPWLGRLAAFSERVSGMPGWVALPQAIVAASLLVAFLGMMWDIAIHADVGRDDGPLATPAHYLILGGLLGTFAAGFIAMALPRERTGPTAVKVAPGWTAPLGGVIITLASGFSLIGFPLDDLWHRLFGQDVTLWGPTHLMLIGGAVTSLIGVAVLTIEGRRANRAAGRRSEAGWVPFVRGTALSGAFLIGLSTFQAEFDYGIPQFSLLFHPLLVMLSAGVALVAVRIWLGPGAALASAGFFIAIRGGMTIIVGPVFGEAVGHFPLYLAEAALVELAALAFAPRSRPLAFGAAAGGLIGTLGLAAEWGWTHVWFPIPWPDAFFPEGAIIGLAGAMAGALLGAWLGARLSSPGAPRTTGQRRAAAAAALTIALAIGFALSTSPDRGVSAQVTLTETAPAPEREARALVRISPADAAEGAYWFDAIGWQGHEPLRHQRLERIGDGVYRTAEPIPLHGSWKTMLRLHKGNSLTALPVFLPADEAIPAPEIAAPPVFTRDFADETRYLQREQNDSATWLRSVGYGIVLALALGLLALVAWALHRVAAASEAQGRPPAAGPTVGPKGSLKAGSEPPSRAAKLPVG